MKIEKINSFQYNITNFAPIRKPQEAKEGSLVDIPNNFQKIAFQGNIVKHFGAQNYLKNEVAPMLKDKTLKDAVDLFSLDLKKLEGIQEGIKVFKGMTMKEIAFLLTTVSEFATIRGCHNNCAHCYGDAKPTIKESTTQTGRMLWEDFTALCSGIKELNQRLGFYASGLKMKDEERYLTTFHDSDCIETVIKDRLGIEHDFIELANIIYDAMGTKVILDTAGWNLTNKAAQKRAQKFVEYYKKPENREVLDQINISFSPFQSINRKSVELRKENKIELANKLRDIYTTRMANVLYTFTPLHKSENFSVLSSCAPDEKEFDGYRAEDMRELFAETIAKLRDLYTEDLEGEQVFVKSKKEIASRISTLKKQFIKPRVITFAERAKRNFGSENENSKTIDKYVSDYIEYLNSIQEKTINEYRKEFVGIIDSNGKYYMTNYFFSIPTELRLNFKNEKETPPIKPNLLDELKITRSMINNF